MAEKYIVVKLSSNAPKKVKNKLSKVLHGTTVTIKGKKYRGKGLIQKYGGIVLCPGTYLIPVNMLKSFLNELDLRGLREHIVVKEACICSCIA